MESDFLKAINELLIIELTFKSAEKGIITRLCVPFDFGPSRRYKDGLDRYHLFDLNSPEGRHNLSILPEQLITITLTENNFTPSDYITWSPNWFVKRDWGIYS